MIKHKPTATLIDRIKRRAKAIAKSGKASHTAALEQGATAAGFKSWFELQRAHVLYANALIEVDPLLPKRFDDTPNNERTRLQLNRWWDRPFAITNADGTYTVKCLDGGAWDRSTYYGTVSSLAAAEQLATDKLRAWQALRSKPHIVYYENTFDLVRLAQRPDESDFIIDTFEDLTAAVKALDILTR